MSNSCNPMDCSLPGSSVHGILQAKVLEWVAVSFHRQFSTQESNLGFLHCRQIFYWLIYEGISSYSSKPPTSCFYSPTLKHFSGTLYRLLLPNTPNTFSCPGLSLGLLPGIPLFPFPQRITIPILLLMTHVFWKG